MRYDTMIFDIDGTLIDSAPAVLKTIQNAVQMTTGKFYDYSELAFTLGLTSRESIQQLVGEDCEEACRIGKELYGEYMEQIALFEGMPETISALHAAGIKLGIVTSKTRKEFNRSFHYSVRDCFDCFLCADDTQKHKPDPEPLLTCAKRLHSAKDACLYIGDTIYDYQCAADAGIAFALALWGAAEPAKIPAGIRLKHPKDICRLAVGKPQAS